MMGGREGGREGGVGWMGIWEMGIKGERECCAIAVYWIVFELIGVWGVFWGWRTENRGFNFIVISLSFSLHL